MSEDEIRATRLEKVEQLKQMGFNPYEYRWESTHHAAQLQEKFADLPSGEEVDLEVAIAGRILARRNRHYSAVPGEKTNPREDGN